MNNRKKIELLAPVGNMEKLEIAIHYGADAIYLGDTRFSLRNFSGNFRLDEIPGAIALAHRHNVKLYVACNIYARSEEQDELREYLCRLGEIEPDAVIMADPGIIMAARELIPEIPIHLSTQANTTSILSARFWETVGIRRIVAARELSLAEISAMVSATSLDIEAFVHGAMCISYSGRCLLSSFMAQRDSNRGMCAQPCRWKYALVEEKRPGEFMPFAEDNRGSYVFNARDLCMIDHMPALIESGIRALKIEGRMKGINYLATTLNTYRAAIDSYYSDPAAYALKPEWIEALASINQRGYCSGFYFGDPRQTLPDYEKTAVVSERRLVGKVTAATRSGQTPVEVRNKLFAGDAVELISAGRRDRRDVIEKIFDPNGHSLPWAQPGSRIQVVFRTDCAANDLIRSINPQESTKGTAL